MPIATRDWPLTVQGVAVGGKKLLESNWGTRRLGQPEMREAGLANGLCHSYSCSLPSESSPPTLITPTAPCTPGLVQVSQNAAASSYAGRRGFRSNDKPVPLAR